MKRWYLLSLLMSIFILCACAGMAAALDPPGADGVYLIGGADDLAEFRDGINSGDIPRNAKAKLTADITLSGTWRPIGRHVIRDSGTLGPDQYGVSEDYSYNGEFDGGGFRISGLSVDAGSAAPFLDANASPNPAGGLFGVLSDDAFVHGLAIDSPAVDLETSMSGSLSLAGAIAGASSGRIEDCHVILNAEITALCSAGGIVGWQEGGSIVGCSVIASGTIKSGEYAGGIAGLLGQKTAGAIRDCSVSGLDLIDSGTKDAGGIAGSVGNENSTIVLNNEVANCTVRGVERITGQEESRNGDKKATAGGVVGRIYSGTVVRNCAAEDIGKVDALVSAGGVVGWAIKSKIIDCAASGAQDIEAGLEHAGGIAGRAEGGSIVNCTVSGAGSIASVSRHAGGILGLGSQTSVRNSIAGGIETLSASKDVGGIGGIAGYATLTDAQTMENCLYFSYPDETTALTAGLYAGGVIGELSGAEASLPYMKNCYYPDHMDFGSFENKPVGNVTSAVSAQNAASYDAEADGLPAIAAMIERGIAVTIGKGDTYALNATTLPGDGTNVTASWTSDSPDVVSVVSQDESGLFVTLRGEALGTANVTCSIRGDVSADLTCAVTVVEALSISPDVLQLQEGVSFDQTCEIARPEDTLWQSMNVVKGFYSDELGIETQHDMVSSSLRIYGTPTATGVYTVSVSAVTDRGQTLAKTVRLQVGGNEPGPIRSGNSSGCAAAGFGMLALLPLVAAYRRNK